MKILKFSTILLLLSMLVISCGQSKKDVVGKITQLEESLFSGQVKGINKVQAAELVAAYNEYADLFPDDSLSPNYLFKAADISMNVFESGQAIELYNKILTSYPNYKKAPQCVFLKAFVYENNLKDLANAKRYYQEFLEKYPEDDFADDAEMSLKNLGKSPEELIKEFEAKSQLEN
jgi:TolA-binding protein